jgi:hypothetical protein
VIDFSNDKPSEANHSELHPMSWEMRAGGRRRYTRSIKQNNRTYRIYIGYGPDAELAAAEDQARQARRRELRQEDTRLSELDAAVDSVCQAIDQLVHVSLYRAGYYRQARGPWRKRGNWYGDT